MSFEAHLSAPKGTSRRSHNSGVDVAEDLRWLKISNICNIVSYAG